MALQNVVRVKPAKPSSGSRISLHAFDRTVPYFTPLNLFFNPSTSGPMQLEEFADSLQDVVDRLPLIAGSIYDAEGAQGVKSKELVDEGRGIDLIWENSPISYVNMHESDSLRPRTLMGNPESSDETLLMVKFTKFPCGTLAMCISLSHMFADCASFVDLIKEWARVSRGDSLSEPLYITSGEREPGKFFPPPIPSAIQPDPGPPNEAPLSLPAPRPAVMINFFITQESLQRLKDLCQPVDPQAWVSTGDCVGALLWRAFTIAREALLEPGCDVHLYMAVDGRTRSKVQPQASKYFGNLVTPITVTLSQSALLGGNVASVALALRHAIEEQLTEANCANILASFESPKTLPGGDNISRMTSWAKFPLVGEELDFGGGAPFWATCTISFPPGIITILRQRDGYLCSFMIETEFASKLSMIDELLTYAKPTTCLSN